MRCPYVSFGKKDAWGAGAGAINVEGARWGRGSCTPYLPHFLSVILKATAEKGAKVEGDIGGRLEKE
ncbi:MAG: hypothetical protein ACJAWN_003180 [Neolewinella sp.]